MTKSRGILPRWPAPEIGSRYGRWTVIGATQRGTGAQPRMVPCRCDCGSTKVIAFKSLRTGNSESCGCVTRKTRNRTHGLSDTPLDVVWCGMRRRCNYPRHEHYSYYGGRGIRVCPEWQHDLAAFAAWALQSGYAAGLQIDRINNDGPYSPENCRWVSQIENAHNKRNNRNITAFGETKCVAEWARDSRCSVSAQRIGKRLMQGWPAERAITELAETRTDRIARAKRQWVDPTFRAHMVDTRKGRKRGEAR